MPLPYLPVAGRELVHFYLGKRRTETILLASTSKVDTRHAPVAFMSRRRGDLRRLASDVERQLPHASMPVDVWMGCNGFRKRWRLKAAHRRWMPSRRFSLRGGASATVTQARLGRSRGKLGFHRRRGLPAKRSRCRPETCHGHNYGLGGANHIAIPCYQEQ